MQDAPSLVIQRLPIDELIIDPSNARLHPDTNLEAIRASLARFGQAEPLVVQASTRRVIGGNGRLAAMRSLGWESCDVVLLDVDDVRATALAIALNRTAELAEWDEDALPKILASLRDAGELEGIGFDEQDLDQLIAAATAELDPTLEDVGPVEPPELPVSRAGDLWLLGSHRLLCGDSTNAEDVARLMNGERASLLATDPPYLVDYRGGNHPQSWANKPEAKDKHWDDYVDPTTGVAFFAAFLKATLEHCIERVPVYQWHATRRQSLVEDAWRSNGLLVHQTIVWVKARPVLTRSHYMWQHEPAFYGWPEGKMPDDDRRPPPSERTVWEIDQIGQQDGIHPTQKPLEIFERPIRFHTRTGEVVLEPFSGSGSQLIAAERFGRRCFAMEISPAFVDAALERWQRVTRRSAVLEQTQQTFEEVRTTRAVD